MSLSNLKSIPFDRILNAPINSLTEIQFINALTWINYLTNQVPSTSNSNSNPKSISIKSPFLDFSLVTNTNDVPTLKTITFSINTSGGQVTISYPVILLISIRPLQISTFSIDFSVALDQISLLNFDSLSSSTSGWNSNNSKASGYLLSSSSSSQASYRIAITGESNVSSGYNSLLLTIESLYNQQATTSSSSGSGTGSGSDTGSGSGNGSGSGTA